MEEQSAKTDDKEEVKDPENSDLIEK